MASWMVGKARNSVSSCSVSSFFFIIYSSFKIFALYNSARDSIRFQYKDRSLIHNFRLIIQCILKIVPLKVLAYAARIKQRGRSIIREKCLSCIQQLQSHEQQFLFLFPRELKSPLNTYRYCISLLQPYSIFTLSQPPPLPPSPTLLSLQTIGHMLEPHKTPTTTIEFVPPITKAQSSGFQQSHLVTQSKLVPTFTPLDLIRVSNINKSLQYVPDCFKCPQNIPASLRPTLLKLNNYAQNKLPSEIVIKRHKNPILSQNTSSKFPNRLDKLGTEALPGIQEICNLTKNRISFKNYPNPISKTQTKPSKRYLKTEQDEADDQNRMSLHTKGMIHSHIYIFNRSKLKNIGTTSEVLETEVSSSETKNKKSKKRSRSYAHQNFHIPSEQEKLKIQEYLRSHNFTIGNSICLKSQKVPIAPRVLASESKNHSRIKTSGEIHGSQRLKTEPPSNPSSYNKKGSNYLIQQSSKDTQGKQRRTKAGFVSPVKLRTTETCSNKLPPLVSVGKDIISAWSIDNKNAGSFISRRRGSSVTSAGQPIK